MHTRREHSDAAGQHLSFGGLQEEVAAAAASAQQPWACVRAGTRVHHLARAAASQNPRARLTCRLCQGPAQHATRGHSGVVAAESTKRVAASPYHPVCVYRLLKQEGWVAYRQVVGV